MARRRVPLSSLLRLLPTRWSASALRRLHGCLALGALAFSPYASLSPSLKASVTFLVEISMLSLVLAEFGAWQSARAEEAGDDAEAIARVVLAELEARFELVPRAAGGDSCSVDG